MMKPHYLLIILCAGYISWAQAAIYKKVDADGHVTYSSTPMKGSQKLDLEPPTIVSSPGRARNNAAPSDSLKVDRATQKNRDNLRREILEEELSTEQKLVEEARQNLKNGKENSKMIEDKDGKSYQNTAKYEENIKALQEQVMLHDKNVEALKVELRKLE